tara:strand:+ start:153 stop:404 length:252 start_codon:yes stop_codon:yes gene_type:complete
MKLVLIDWRDTYEMDAGWHSVESAKAWRTCICRSVGFLLEETEQEVIICGDAGIDNKEFDEVGRVQAIPKGCIVNMSTLRELG